MSRGHDRLIAELREKLGATVVVTDPDLIAPWLTDWRGRWTGKAAAMLQPGTREEVSTILAAANEAGVPLVPQGGNSSMVGGATPDQSGDMVILSLRRMKEIRAIDPETRQCVVEAGMILATLQDELAEVGLRLPLDLGARGSATIGGLVSTNAGGTEVLRHGTMGEQVLGLEAVLADGSVIDTLSPLKKDNRGPRIDRMMIGGEGQFGVITAVRLQLTALPSDRATAWVGVASPQAALKLLRFCEQECDAVEGFELLPKDSLAAAEAVFDLRAPLDGDHDWQVLIEAKGESEAGTLNEKLGSILAGAIEQGLAQDAVLAQSEAQAEAFWSIRHHLSDAEKRHYGMANSHDISVPVDAMPAFLKEVRDRIEADYPGAWVSGYGHLGDGNIHLHVRPMDRASDDWRATEGAEIERKVHDMIVAHGGSISAEHGIGQMKRDEFARLGEPARLAMLRALKQALDPKRILNPGKLIP
ncbi:FAD-binding oxidoreductase [Sphingomicrobium sediminis]|uniref:FAD-binding oxidoreductase n=1 Tax=Sphingomicrobium sediminis TaxID=2950949 RepID=A0A9X2EHA8_9SPHN|nr:FAD-binding oxidoreductase [Sphingomicrobium sediminis]MCM8557466.1 FAD-binding oxidoreductase [Sphingomicrobium sediminis]